jgi:hypothetical protein
MAPGVGIYCDPHEKGLLRGGETGEWTITGKMVQEAGLSMRDDQIANVIYHGNFATGQDKLRLPTGSLTALCQWGLPEGYISDDVFGQIYDYDSETWKRGLNQDKMAVVDEDDKTDPKGNLILILYDDIQTRENIRGFALCNVREGNMILLVLGATKPSVELRGKKSFARGGMLLRLVQYLGSNLNYISLYALETVITLYAHFGWKFMDPDRCKIKETQNPIDRKNAQNISELKQLYKKAYPAEPNEEELTKMLKKKFGRYAKNFHTLVRTGQNKDDDGSFTAAEEGRENGYIMILCKRDNPYSTTYIPPSALGKHSRHEGGNKDIINADESLELEEIYKTYIQSIPNIEIPNIEIPNIKLPRKEEMEKKAKTTKGGKRRTKKRALRKKHRGRKTKGKKKKNKKWCKSTKKWCKSTKKNNCKKGLWKKKTKLGRASRKWCKSTKKWRKKACKKRR